VRPRPPLPPGPYLVVGLARSGAGAAVMLLEHGEVIGVDSGSPPEADAIPSPIEVHLDSDGLDLLDRARTVVKSPGVPREAPVIAAAIERGIDVLGELEMAWRLMSCEFLAVTGTNGKTTTAELLGAIHREAGMDVAVAGNVGTAVSSLVGALHHSCVLVCEVSSFQLEDATAFAPEGALLLNIEADHLDRHGTFDAYREAKLRIFANQEEGDVAVIPADLDVARPLPATVVTFGDGAGPDMAVNDAGELEWRGEPLMAAADVRMRGDHNRANATAAAAMALARGIEPEAVARALRAFPGVPHRLEEVARRDGVLYVNDSKATNVASATVGIRAFEGGVHLILGGSLKGGDFRGLREPVSERCRACYLIGQASDQLSRDLEGTVPLHPCGDLERAVRAASEAARPSDVVLLSPACASYDQYRDYEERGAHFRRLAGEA
jgi:UDP-N-acetylmuramoylalanine--D-glutamate ligase